MKYNVINRQMSLSKQRIMFLINNEFSECEMQDFSISELKAFVVKQRENIGLASSYFDFFDRFFRQNGFDTIYKYSEPYPNLIAVPTQHLVEFTTDIFELRTKYRKVK